MKNALDRPETWVFEYGKSRVSVVAQTWFVARAKAAALLGALELGEVVCVVNPTETA